MTLREAADICTHVLKQGRARTDVDPRKAEQCARLALKMMAVLNRARQVAVTARPISPGDAEVAARQRELQDAYAKLVTETLDFEDWLEAERW